MKRLLILRACGVSGEQEECNAICNKAGLYGINVVDKCPKTNEELLDVMAKNGKFDYIYLSSHGDSEGFSNEEGTVNMNWSDFGYNLCEKEVMNENCVIMLSCCRGGLHQVAYELFYNCSQISYIVGPRQSLTPAEMLISFSIFLFNIENRNIDPVVACQKIQAGTDIRFVCFDRLETEIETGYLMYKSSVEEAYNKLVAEAQLANPVIEQVVSNEVTKK